MLILKISYRNIHLVGSIIFIAFALNGCVNREQQKKINLQLEDITETSALVSKSIKIDLPRFNPNRIISTDKYVIVLQTKGDNLFSVLEYSDLSVLSGFGRIGKGPDELFAPLYASFKPVKNSKNILGIIDGDKLYHFNFIKGSSVSKITLPPNYKRFRAIGYPSLETLIGVPYIPDVDLIYYNTSSEKSVLTPMDSAIDKDGIGIYNGSYIALNKSANLYARAFEFLGKIELRETVSGKLIKEIIYKEGPDVSNFENRESRDHTIFSWGISASDKSFFVKIFNLPYKKLVKDFLPSKEVIAELHEFDWEGTPIRIIRPNHDFTDFTVSKDGRYLYTYSIHKEGYLEVYTLDN